MDDHGRRERDPAVVMASQGGQRCFAVQAIQLLVHLWAVGCIPGHVGLDDQANGSYPVEVLVLGDRDPLLQAERPPLEAVLRPVAPLGVDAQLPVEPLEEVTPQRSGSGRYPEVGLTRARGVGERACGGGLGGFVLTHGSLLSLPFRGRSWHLGRVAGLPGGHRAESLAPLWIGLRALPELCRWGQTKGPAWQDRTQG
jgi:hypothetical protein